jgi:hypothetical protein
MKYVIEIKELEAPPKDWQHRTNWEGDGLYTVKSESFSLYYVYQHGVQYLSYPEQLMKNPLVESGESVSESLLLKAIAAAAHAKVLT